MLRFNGSLLPTKGEKKNAGFSLVELMVVVAIIGILAALAIGRFGNMTINARRSEAFANMNQIRTLSEVWGQDNAFAYNVPANYTLANIGFTAPNGARFTYALGNGGLASVFAPAAGNNGYSAIATANANQVCDQGVAGANLMVVALDPRRVAGTSIWMTRACGGAITP